MITTKLFLCLLGVVGATVATTRSMVVRTVNKNVNVLKSFNQSKSIESMFICVNSLLVYYVLLFVLANIIWYEIIYYVSSSYDNKIFIIYPINQWNHYYLCLVVYIIFINYISHLQHILLLIFFIIMFFNNTLFKPVAIHSILGLYNLSIIVTYIILLLEIIIGKEHYNYDWSDVRP